MNGPKKEALVTASHRTLSRQADPVPVFPLPPMISSKTKYIAF